MTAPIDQPHPNRTTAPIGLLYSLAEYWDLIHTLLEAARPRRVVEVGVEAGGFSIRLLDYCESRGAAYCGIDPAPDAGVAERIAALGHRLVRAPSTQALEAEADAEVHFLDGDHNYATVAAELAAIFAAPSGAQLVFVHDVGWPCGRRDLYYGAAPVAPEARQPSRAEGGPFPGRPSLGDDGLRVRGAAFALHEGGARNGVLTAVEDALAGRADWRLIVVPAVFGLGILVNEARIGAAVREALARVEGGLALVGPLLERLEATRLDNYAARIHLQRRVACAETAAAMASRRPSRPAPSRRPRTRRGEPRVGALAALVGALPERGALFVDMFDTLVRRRVDPPHVVIDLAIAAAGDILLRNGLWVEHHTLQALRAEVTRELQEAAVGRGEDPESTISEMWAEIVTRLTGAWPTASLVEELVGAELAVERAVLEAMPGATELLRAAKRKGLDVCVLSDTYYSSGQLEELLRGAGLADLVDAVHSSGELRKGKYSGKMFAHVLAARGHQPGDVLHAGDHPHSDLASPRACGVRAVLYDRPKEYRRRQGAAKQGPRAALRRQLAGHLAELCRAAPPPAWRDAGDAKAAELHAIGFHRFGPAVYAFVKDLVKWCEATGTEDVHFVARDGYVLRQIFDRLTVGLPRLRSHYLCLSRRSVTAAGESAEARARLEGYLEDAGFFGGGRRAFVDIGWHGGIQLQLGCLYGHRADFPSLDGIYLGRAGGKPYVPGLRSRILPGFLVDFEGRLGRASPPAGLAPLLELATGAPHGTTLGYRADGSRVVPVMAPPDPREALARPLREGVLDFADWYERARETAGSAMPDALFRIGAVTELLALHASPARREARAFAGVVFDLGLSTRDELDLTYARLSFPRFLRLWLARRMHADAWRQGAVAYRGIPVRLDDLLKDVMRTAKRWRLA